VPDLQAARGAPLTATKTQESTVAARRTGLALGIGLVGLAVDQATKIVAVRELTDREPVEVVGEVLRLVLVYNPGAAFGAGASITPVITVIAIVATCVVLWQMTKVRHLGWAVALGLLLAGVLGNLTDRLLRDPGPFRGHVVDFLALPNWPVFNVADMCINVAGVLLVVLLLRGVGVDGSREGELASQETPG
jgi:signal peptidase II